MSDIERNILNDFVGHCRYQAEYVKRLRRELADAESRLQRMTKQAAEMSIEINE